MNLKKASFALIAGLFLLNPIKAQELTGDAKLSCEAILCLSSSVGRGLSECSPSLDRYFGISHKYLSDTIKARLNFLNICPTVKTDPKMGTLVEAIANAAGSCDIAKLNRQYPACGTGLGAGFEGVNLGLRECKPLKLPAACTALANHEYTDIKLPKWQCTKKMPRMEFERQKNNRNGAINKLSYGISSELTKNLPSGEVCVQARWIEE